MDKVTVLQATEVENCLTDGCYYIECENGNYVCEHWEKKIRILDVNDEIPKDSPFRKKKKKKGKSK